MPVRVTLLIPNYNGARFLRETVARLLAQTYRDFHLLVADNCSTDDSERIVASFADPRLRWVPADRHVPLVANFNRAMAMAETEYLATCASDEVYEPGWLAEMVRLLDSHSGAFFACCKADSADENGRVYLANPERYKGSFWPPDEPCLFDRTCLPRLLRANFCICTTGVYRAECVRRIGPVDEQHNFAGDWQYWARGLIAGYTIVGTHRPLVHYRRHAHAMTRQYAANFYRFQDELDVIRWIAEEGHRHGLLSTPVPDYGLVRNTLMSEYAARLAAGDRENADRLLDFAGERVPGFRGSAYDRLARGARRLGRAGGAGLRALESAYLWLLARGERRPAITVAATPESPPGAAP